ncbi:glycerol-3-phosphate dehydrogenase/oxidase [Carboxydochorda subterranea]|uniref:Glycerol-3-phosphate dehydrogenase n=1 Tax=Carboxydichorda subterranea TaxID=3109565 RepID=A0ABZ1BXU6_9FIRM|nr:glycerol-3-phosphate dehydrogenase/oxidase [Limnochorda sp. L945t]WRP17330.1 glycerol-3-phosphate dehydrogenase/oxidase [Limnochorda sp. L945t]
MGLAEDLTATTRTSTLEGMQAAGVDLLVIGGGITGAGVALDAATRGLRVGLVEQWDFASGTSSRSTKLVHGGIRYLPMLDFGLVREGLIERSLLAANAPHLVRPLPFVVPFYQGLKRPMGMRLPAAGRAFMPYAMRTGLWMYDRLAGRMVLIRHRAIGLAESLRLCPYLRREGLQQASLYYDAQTDDARLTMAVIRTAARYGALPVNYARAVSLVRREGRVAGAEVEDRLTGRRYTVAARWVVNASGVWAGQVAALAGSDRSIRLSLSKGVHLVMPRELLGIGEAALVLPETEDGRLAFVVPWEGLAVVGTTDTPYDGSPEDPPVTTEDVEYLLRHVRRFLNVHVDTSDVIAAYAGLRPLISAGARSADLSRRHAVVRHEPGLVSIIGGKLTAYRRMAQDTVDAIAAEEARQGAGGMSVPACRTRQLPLVGADAPEAWPDLVREGIHMGLEPAISQRLLHTYGHEMGRLLQVMKEDADLARPIVPGLPWLRAEVVFACRATMAVTLEDMLVRRLRVSLAAPGGGVPAAGPVAELMAEALGWSLERRRAELEHYQERAERAAAWR